MKAATAGPLSGGAVSEAAHGVARSDAEATNAAHNRGFYAKRVPIHPKAVSGTFRTIKWAALIALLGLYYIVPWLRWDRGPNAPDQAVLVDLANERFYFFFIEIWPQEVYYLTGLLILAAIGLFLATALFGRLWCGYACPQTVWTDLFILVERLIEGDRASRIRLAKSGFSAGKAARKISKHAIWLLIAAATGGAWILYFHDAPSLARDVLIGEAPFSAYVFFGVLTFTTYSLAGTMREQVCTYMCPWPRIQAALIDKETLNVTYRTDRGEPRGPHRKGETWEGRGDCIDCRQCVAACPMGIDIRDGIQLECINCALCIDACDEVMGRIGRPKGLIGYDTDLNIARRAAGAPAHFQFIRPRTIFYAVVLAAVSAVMLYGLTTRATLDLNVLRDRNPTHVVLSDGSVSNAYTVKILNKEARPRSFDLYVDGPPGISISAVGIAEGALPLRILAEPDRLRTVRLFAVLPPDEARPVSIPITVRIVDPETGAETVNPTVFLSGGR